MVTIDELIEALQASWDQTTSSWGTYLPESNKARGQCVATSLVVQDYLGGDIVRVHASGADIDEKHYFNKLPNGTILDTTALQYDVPVTFTPSPVDLQTRGFKSVREKRLSDNETRQKYETLKHKVDAYLKEKTHGTI
jgi:hypothetical protein